MPCGGGGNGGEGTARALKRAVIASATMKTTGNREGIGHCSRSMIRFVEPQKSDSEAGFLNKVHVLVRRSSAPLQAV
jgi:hypothetical protein